ncbi:MAG TPA: hypothetical protein VF768_10760 [Holophagaceae bacterium]
MRRWVLAFLLPLALKAGTWDPIPAEVWTISPGSPQGAFGAIFLTDWSRYGVNDTEHRLRILILSEAGKSAAQIEPFSPLLGKVEGRTIYPDGRELDFNKAQDFADQVIKVGSEDISRKVLVPPGLTDHCIVDLHWTDRGTYLWGTRFDRQIQRSYPIQKLEVQLAIQSPMASVWLRPQTMPMESSMDRLYRIYTFRDLPPLEAEPYSREAWRYRPKLMCFAQPQVLREFIGKGSDAYWQAVAKELVRPFYQKELDSGRKYRLLSSEIRDGLPQDPLKKAAAIVDRLYARVLNVSALTAAEKEARSKRDAEKTIHPRDLDESADRRWTNGEGMFYLAYQLFTDADLNPRILRVSDRDQREFRYEIPDFYQFDDSLLGIPGADGKTIVWCDPSRRYLPFGVINPDYQGTPALIIDTKDWSAKKYWVPFQEPDVNRREYRFEIEPGAEVDTFKVRTEYFGFESSIGRSNYYALTPKQAEAQLKSELESSKRYTITRAAVPDAADRGKPVVREVEGTRESEGGRRRLIDPFPTQECPLWVPETWPAHRTGPVVMAYTSTYRSTSRIRIPEGWHAVLPNDLDRKNPFGQVSWRARETEDAKGKAVEVSYEVTVSKLFGGLEAEQSLRDFLTWMKTGWSQAISLERTR